MCRESVYVRSVRSGLFAVTYCGRGISVIIMQYRNVYHILIWPFQPFYYLPQIISNRRSKIRYQKLNRKRGEDYQNDKKQHERKMKMKMIFGVSF